MARGKHNPLRTCTGCGQKRGQRDLLRVVRVSDAHVESDVTGRRVGRGAYVCPNPACVELARKKSSLSRSLGVSISREAWASIEQAVLVVMGRSKSCS